MALIVPFLQLQMISAKAGNLVIQLLEVLAFSPLLRKLKMEIYMPIYAIMVLHLNACNIPFLKTEA